MAQGCLQGCLLLSCVVPAGKANIDLKSPQLFYLHSARTGLVNVGGLHGLDSSEFRAFIICRFFCVAARLKGTSGLTTRVGHVERDGVYFLASFEGQRSTALCQPLSAELMCLSNPMDSAFYVFHCVCHPSHVSWHSWYKPGMFHTQTARYLVKKCWNYVFLLNSFLSLYFFTGKKFVKLDPEQ